MYISPLIIQLITSVLSIVNKCFIRHETGIYYNEYNEDEYSLGEVVA